MCETEALVIIDAQRGFMPLEEGESLGQPGFGELPVGDGEQIINPLNVITHAFRSHALPIAYTADKHNLPTAHISDHPNYVDTWPVHCLENSPGSELHPSLYIAHYKSISTAFFKGQVAVATPEEDDSYSGALARNPETNKTLPEWLNGHHVTQVYLGGLALGDGEDHKLCVDSTAVDLKNLGYDVAILTDAVKAVNPENVTKCFTKLGKLGIRLVTTGDAIALVDGERS